LEQLLKCEPVDFTPLTTIRTVLAVYNGVTIQTTIVFHIAKENKYLEIEHLSLARMKANDYNSIAKLYDPLSRLIFFGAIQKSQLAFLGLIPDHSKVLFIGGGNGYTLHKLFSINPNLEVVYLELSAKMIDLSKNKLSQESLDKVLFIHGNESQIPDLEYDVVISFYFLDLFQRKRGLNIFMLLDQRLKPGGIWLIADFNVPKRFYQKCIEKLMFAFLKISTQIEARNIYDYKDYFNSDYIQLKEKSFYDKFIFSSVYTKRLE